MAFNDSDVQQKQQQTCEEIAAVYKSGLIKSVLKNMKIS